MKNEKSYSELVKAHSTKKAKTAATIQELLIEMIIHESILNIPAQEILRNKLMMPLILKTNHLFLQLSTEMNQLLKQFGA